MEYCAFLPLNLNKNKRGDRRTIRPSGAQHKTSLLTLKTFPTMRNRFMAVCTLMAAAAMVFVSCKDAEAVSYTHLTLPTT